ncbi:hypothetical protein PRIPAC_85357, partial [Pristionchus pacificus]|uniref:Uncharacterized protein n=1 Tax=Pristionchus pacificus TaxID=54126 RepID=A0A2A6CCG4_PRIPA
SLYLDLFPHVKPSGANGRSTCKMNLPIVISTPKNPKTHSVPNTFGFVRFLSERPHKTIRASKSTPTHAATRVMNTHRNKLLFRMAKDQTWVKRITLLTGSYRYAYFISRFLHEVRPRSFADQLPAIFEENFSAPQSEDNKTIEDWYLQRNKARFMAEIDLLEKMVRKVGILQFKQEMNDYMEAVRLRIGQIRMCLAQLKNFDSLKQCVLGFLGVLMTMGKFILHVDLPLAPDGLT